MIDERHLHSVDFDVTNAASSTNRLLPSIS